MLRRILIVAGLLLGLVIFVFGLSFIASERGGEVVTLRTADAAGAIHETRIWVVDADGRMWLRAGDPKSGWLARLSEKSQVDVERGGQRATYTAVPLPAERDRINALFLTKYGIADRYIAVLFGRDDATPIRLDPAP
jgi:hypothetical protein